MDRRFAGLLLRPSFFTSVINTIGTAVILGVANWSDMLQKFFIYDYLFGDTGLVTQLNHNQDGTVSTGGSLFGGAIGYNILILGTALFVGLVVYIVLQVLGRVANDASATWESLHAQTENGIRAIARRSVIRILVAVSWLIYLVMFIKIILPFCILASQVGIRELWSVQGFGYIAFGAVVLWITLHIHAIFLRLIFLRPRVFGGNDEILEDEFRHHYQV
jgi:hypothetical protein